MEKKKCKTLAKVLGIVAVILVALALTGCGISQEEHNKVLEEKANLIETLNSYQDAHTQLTEEKDSLIAENENLKAKETAFINRSN